jgi:hypothetical protein
MEDSPFGPAEMGQRNAFAAGFNSEGHLVDVGNNVGKTNEAFAPFEVSPFALGTCSTVAEGQPVPTGSVLTFDFNLADPLVRGYLQEACHAGRLRLMITSLHHSSFGDQPVQPLWPEFYTADSVLGDPPTLALQGTAVRPLDDDADQLPDDWEQFYFGTLAETGPSDTDQDGQTNREEYAANTHPNDAASRLAIANFERLMDQSVLRFQPASSRQYGVEYSDDLSTWKPVEAPKFVYLPGSLIEWRADSALDGPGLARRFYRVTLK